ncbi:MAG: hypothetical protein QM786_00455 [Breznakibacter sp.]
MQKPLPFFSFLLLLAHLFCLPASASHKEIGSTRYFPSSDGIRQVEEMLTGSLMGNVQETTGETHPLDVIKQKVISEKRLVSQLDSASFFTLPIGVNGGGEKGDDYAIIIDNATIYPDYAEFSAFMSLVSPFDGKTVRFRADNIRFTFKGGLSSNVKLALLDAISTTVVKDVTINWLKGSFVEWDCNGFKQIGLNGEVELSDKTFIGVNPQTGSVTGKVKSSFYVNFADFNDFLFQTSFSPFKIKGFDEAYFSFQDVTLDFSDLVNGNGFKLPQNYPGGYTGDKTSLWRGLYIHKAQVFLSQKFNKKSGSTTSFFAEGLIVDDYGFSGLCGIDNLLSMNDGELGNWPMSIDRLALEFFTGSFKSFVLTGGTKLPGTNTPLGYDAFFDTEGTYHLAIQTKEEIKFDLLAAQIGIDPSSVISVHVEKGDFVPTALLNGYISFDCPIAEGGDKALVKMPKLKFEGLRMSAEAPVFDINYLGFDSGSGNIFNGFPISITKIGFRKVNANDARIDVGVHVNFGNEDISGTTEFSVKANTQEWKFKGLSLSSIEIRAKKDGAFELEGSVAFADGDKVYGDGFRGKISAVFGKSIEVDALAVFGNVSGFRYFFVDAFLHLPGQGIPAGPFIINGFGGGLYVKMRQLASGDNGGSTFGESLSGLIYVPDENISLGINAALGGGVIDPQLIDVKATFGINFNRHGGINQIAFTGEASVVSPDGASSSAAVADMAKTSAGGGKQRVRDNAPIKVSTAILLDFERDTYDASFEAFVNVAGVLKGIGTDNRAGWGVLHIEPGKWYLRMGTPSDPIGLNIVGIVKTGSYFMAGHDLPDAMLMNTKVLDILNMSQADFNGNRSESDLVLGKGLAFGANFSVSTGEKTFLIFYGSFDLGAGFDVMLIDYGDNAYCQGRNGGVGIDGWYAKGQSYAYFGGSIGVKVKVFRKKRKFDILNIQTATAMRMEGPNPFWLKGAVGGKYRILGGMVKGNCKFEVTIGEKCELVTSKELSDMEIIADITPAADSKDVDIFTLPQVVFNVPVEKEMKISEDENTSKEFKVKLNEYAVYYNGTAMPGSMEWDNDKTVLAFTPDEIFRPNSEYKAMVRISFEEKVDGQWTAYKDDSGEIYYETKEAVFTTGNLPDKIPDNYVSYSYPIHRMMNFYKLEHDTAYVTFKAGLKAFFEPMSGWEQKARWTPVKEGQTLYSPLVYNTALKSAEAMVPHQMQNGQMYRFELVNVPLDANNAVDRNIQTSTETVDLGESDESLQTEISTRQAEGSISDAEEKAFYGITFRCSRSDRFLDKVPANDMTVRFLYNVSPAIDYPGVTVYGNEMFDRFEIAGTTSLRPLMQVKALLEDADWYQANIFPLMYQHYPLHVQATVSRNTAENGLPPGKPVSIWQIDYTYELTDADMESGQMSSRAVLAHFVYGLPSVWAADYIEIRNKLSNLVANGLVSRSNAQANKILNTYPWPQVSAGNYPIRLEYVRPGRGVSSAKTIRMVNPFNVPQVNLLSQ